MKILVGVLIVVLMFGAGLAFGYALGRCQGFLTGSEWAIVQADISAREAGVIMPVSYHDGRFHIVLPQPRGIYRKARNQAELVKEPLLPFPEPEKQQVMEGLDRLTGVVAYAAAERTSDPNEQPASGAAHRDDP